MASKAYGNGSNLYRESRIDRHRPRLLWRRTVVVAFLFGTIVTGVAVASAQSNPEDVAKALDEALNAHDVDAAMALWAEDAVVTQRPPQPGSTGVYEGTAEIRGFLEGLVAQNVHFELAVPHEVNGDHVTWTNNTSFDAWRNLGIAPLQGQGQITVRNGLIAEFSVALTPESQAKLQERLASLPGPPSTGSGGTALPRSYGNGILMATLVAAATIVAAPALVLGARRVRR